MGWITQVHTCNSSSPIRPVWLCWARPSDLPRAAEVAVVDVAVVQHVTFDPFWHKLDHI